VLSFQHHTFSINSSFIVHIRFVNLKVEKEQSFSKRKTSIREPQSFNKRLAVVNDVMANDNNSGLNNWL